MPAACGRCVLTPARDACHTVAGGGCMGDTANPPPPPQPRGLRRAWGRRVEARGLNGRKVHMGPVARARLVIGGGYSRPSEPFTVSVCVRR